MKRLAAVLCLFSLILTAVAAAAEVHAQDFTSVIAEADAAFDRWTGTFKFSAYQERLEAAVSLWEQALPLIVDANVQTRSHVLNHSAQAYFELGEAYLVSPEEREEAYGKAKEYALASLRLDPVFGTTEEEGGFRAALLSARDVTAILWYGNTLGQWLKYHQVTAILGGVLDVLASYERAIELDETYLGGAPQRSMAVLIAQAYFVIGKPRDDAVVHYERPMEIDPAYLESYVNYAQHHARPTGDETLFTDLLATAMQLAEDPQVTAAWPFYSELALRRARTMLP